MKKVLYALLLSLFAMNLSSCKSGESVSTSPGSLQGDWTILAVNGQEIPADSQDQHTVSFNTDGTVAGLAACNRFAGEYSAQEEGAVTMNGVSATKLECDSGSADFLSTLQSVNSFKITGGNQLELASSSGNLIFSKVMMEGEEG
jgi:heat shock protein HslJ